MKLYVLWVNTKKLEESSLLIRKNKEIYKYKFKIEISIMVQLICFLSNSKKKNNYILYVKHIYYIVN